MREGISVWLDVPLEALVKRISAVGTNSRPLLHNDSTDAYSKVQFLCLFPLVHKYDFPGFWICEIPLRLERGTKHSL